MTMKYRGFGATDLTVSEIGFGCARLGGVFQTVTTAEMLRALGDALEQGITFFDTADMYTQGESERLLGQAIRGRRSQVVIASKAGYCLPGRRKFVAQIKPLVRPIIQRLGVTRARLPAGVSGALSQDFSASHILSAVDGSLKRLGTDYLDLYQMHSPPREVLESGEFLAPLEQLQRDGKIRYFGVSCETTDDALICLRFPSISSLQIRMSLLDQSALESAIPQARERNVALIARECFAGGLLTKPLDALGLDDLIPDPVAREAKYEEAAGYAAVAREAQRPLAEMALHFVSDLDSIVVTLLGMRTPAQVAGNLQRWASPALSAVEYAALRARWAA
jgi:aryl-alcohol dehydrogenase-like predicted oxidoreductase